MATKSQSRQFPTRIDIPEEKRAALVGLLNRTLADLSDLYSQVRVAHWNVKGPNFYQLHKLFETLYEELGEAIDEVAERATTLGGYAHGTVRNAAENSSLDEYPEEAVAGLDHVAALSDRYAQVAAHLREAIGTSDDHGDPSTADLYTTISRQVDMRLWFLEAHLQTKGE